jgi:BirA family biotin operon repressor/biotin-[acetyl-CoA-carboxylase] ligase
VRGAELQAALAEIALVRRIHFFEELGSTSDFAKELAAGARHGVTVHGTLVVALHQTAGRGRHRRRWEAPPGAALLFSLVVDGVHAPLLPMAAPVAVCEGIAAVEPGLCPRIKYPNDILLSGRKAGGVLLEQAGPAVVVGVGVNVSQSAGQLPQGARVAATSLALELGRAADTVGLLTAILARLGNYMSPELDAALAGRMNALCDTIGREVEVDTSGGVVRGTAMSVAADGALMVRTEAGTQRALYSGDVMEMRALNR